jgi:MFS family permease
MRALSAGSGLRPLFITTLISRVGMMAFPFFSAYLLIHGGLRPGGVGLVVGVFGIGALAADASASVFLGRLPARTVMIAGLGLQAAVLCAIPWVGGLGPLLAGSCLWGFGYEMYTPAAACRIVALCAPEERRMAFAMNRLAINAGMGIGPTIGGLVFACSPELLFYLNAGAALTASVYLLLHGDAAQPDRPPPDRAAPRRGPVPAAPGGRSTQFWTVFTLALPVHVAYALPSVFLSAYVVTGLRLPSSRASLLFAANALLIIVFEVPLNALLRSVSLWRSLLIGYAFAGVGFAAMGLSSHFAVLLAATVGWTVAEMVVYPALLSYVSEISAPAVVERNLSLYSGGANIGIVLAPTVSVAAAGAMTPGAPWVLAGTAVLIAGGLVAAARISVRTWYPGPAA